MSERANYPGPLARIVPECTGECCREFPLNIEGGLDMLKLGMELGKVDPKEGAKLLDMLIPLGKTHPNNDQFEMFTCRYWDTETKRCLNYENRPQMCWDYPYDRGRCHVCGATGPNWEPPAKAPLVVVEEAA